MITKVAICKLIRKGGGGRLERKGKMEILILAYGAARRREEVDTWASRVFGISVRRIHYVSYGGPIAGRVRQLTMIGVEMKHRSR